MAVFYITKKGENSYSFSLLTENNRKILSSTKNFPSVRACKICIENIVKYANESLRANSIDDHTTNKKMPYRRSKPTPRFEIYRDSRGMYRYRLFDGAGDEILLSSGSFSKSVCQNSIKRLASLVSGSHIVDRAQRGDVIRGFVSANI